MWSRLRSTHPLRRLLKPFEFRTIAINMNAASQLTSEFGLFHRASALTESGLRAAFDYIYKNRVSPDHFFTADLNQSAKAELLKLHSTHGRYPCGQDGDDFFQIVHTLVTEYLGVYYPNDARCATQSIFLWHTRVK
eukprot:SAG31_NODE_1173_length_9543_cov_8.654913_6_plen_136_part_00